MINPYGPCVANKWKDGGGLTMVWHVDNMKVSHKSKGKSSLGSGTASW